MIEINQEIFKKELEEELTSTRTMSFGYRLEGHTPVLDEEWYKKMGDDRFVAKDRFLGDYEVSTVFLGLDHGYGFGPPVLFETMIFRKKDPETLLGITFYAESFYIDSYSTWDQAVEGHKKACQFVRNIFSKRLRKKRYRMPFERFQKKYHYRRL